MEFINEFIDRKHGRKKIEYLHPLLESILEETYGIIVYQEQVIQIANKIAGMSLAEADLLRRAMGKKDLKAMQQQKKKFIEGAVKNEISKKVAEEIFEVIDKFANYGFNKSHAVAYSIVAYQTAYLKAHYLPEFLAANLTNEYQNIDKVTIFLEDCRKLKVKVLPPNINKPSVYFNVIDNSVIFGMCAIKNVGVGAVEEISSTREELGRDFKSIFDLCANIDTRIVNKRALEGLVQAGAFDNFAGSRARHFSAIETALSFGSKAQSAKNSHVDSLFGDVEEDLEIIEPPLPEVEDWSDTTLMAKEREVLGFYLSHHPLDKFEAEYNSFASVKLGQPETFRFGDKVNAVGVVTQVRTKIDKSNKQMAFFKIDDFSGSCECLMFSKIYVDYGQYLTEESTVLVNGTLESSGDAIKLHADEVMPLEEAKFNLTKKLIIYADPEKHDSDSIVKLKSLLENYSGQIPVYLCYSDNGSYRNFFLDYKVKITPELIADLEAVLGDKCIRYLTS
jgi:DNA polymerase-3 subunit alpha